MRHLLSTVAAGRTGHHADERTASVRATWRQRLRYRGRHHLPLPPRRSRRRATVIGLTVLGTGLLGTAASASVTGAAAAGHTASPRATRSLPDRSGTGGAASRGLTRPTPSSASPSPTASATPAPRWALPVRISYDVTSEFGTRWGVLHAGVDLAVPTGTPIYAAHAGTVTVAGWDGGYGEGVEIDDGAGLSTVYGHNSQLVVSAGQQVALGQLIAYAGSTGDATGPHCHFELRRDGVAFDPLPYLRQQGLDVTARAAHVESNDGADLK
jgi:murein DD-endopeptidase MepM/ murein hydrolase activator NlpD